MKVTNIKPRIGAEIETDIETLLSGSLAAEIRETLEDRGVIVFRELNLTDDQQVAFTKTLGNIVDEGEDNIYKISVDPNENPRAEYLKGAFYWHLDGALLDVPIFASLLNGLNPSETGGQTEFANTYAAYDDLPESEKNALSKLKVVHSMAHSQLYWNPEPSYEQWQDYQQMKQNTIPLVWKHRSGRNSLVLGCTASYIEGMSAEDSQDLLIRLRDWATQPQFSYSHEWKKGDLVMWDNTGTLHRARPYAADSGRMMHRTKLSGEESFA